MNDDMALHHVELWVPDLAGGPHERRRPGLNHLAFAMSAAGPASARARVDALAAAAPGHGWAPLFPGRYPRAGGPGHYAAYLENRDGFEAEVVAHG
jgi:hypothetical protein